ncbi:MAG: isochorismatase family protein [Clostridia bacterium]|nr:isochorismatase family protein [Clostridia bacterium]
MKRINNIFLLVISTFVFVFGAASSSFAAPQDLKSGLDAKNTVLVVIDVQKFFIPGDPDSFSAEIPGQNTPNKIANVKALIQMAKRTGMKTLVTYEGSSEGTYAMPEELKNELPSGNTVEFIKSYFDITKKVEVDRYLAGTGAKNLIVCGAETDVCVLQSVTGLLKKGYNVFLADDATYTSTTLNAPAVKKMEMSGAGISLTKDLMNAVEKGVALPKAQNIHTYKTIPDLERSKEAIFVVNFDDESLQSVTDPKKDAKIMRIQYLTHYADIMQLPIYFLYDGSMENTKKMLFIPPTAQFLKTDKTLFCTSRKVLADLKSKNINQIVMGGIDENEQVVSAAQILKSIQLEVYLMEDAYFKNGGTDYSILNKMYKRHIIPSSLKMFFYDSTESASIDDIPMDMVERYFAKLDSGAISYIESLPFVRDSQY